MAHWHGIALEVRSLPIVSGARRHRSVGPQEYRHLHGLMSGRVARVVCSYSSSLPTVLTHVKEPTPRQCLSVTAY